jgi:hypothetical protein
MTLVTESLGWPTSQSHPLALIDRLEAIWNTLKLDRVLSFFADNAVLRIVLAPPGVLGSYTGKAELCRFLHERIAGSQIWFRSQHQAAERLLWIAKLSAAALPQQGDSQSSFR